jgi:hypothetical protein
MRYHSSYHSAYVLDPDGNNIEAIYRANGTTVIAVRPAPIKSR